jgi:hypothetical protein
MCYFTKLCKFGLIVKVDEEARVGYKILRSLQKIDEVRFG